MLDTFKALADPIRLRLVAILLSGEFTVQELTSILQLGQSKVSWHLKILTDSRILTVKKQGTWSYYRVGSDNPFFATIQSAVVTALGDLSGRGQDLAAVAQVLEVRRRKSHEFFERHAEQWDELARTLLPVPEYRRQLLQLVPVGGTVLEIGIGTGGLLPALAARAERVIGVDHAPAMLEEARRRLSAAGISGVELRLGEISHLPLPDCSVDCAVANMVLHHAADPPAVLHEICRVLTPGGLLVLADLARHEREVARERLADQWLGFEESELREWLSSNGYSEASIERIDAAPGQEPVLLVRAIRKSTTIQSGK